jgi:hypothetical protein
MNWQPIETAPKDGRIILGWQGNKGRWQGRGIHEVRWSNDGYIDGWFCIYDEDEQTNPSHWMPLPEPPK